MTKTHQHLFDYRLHLVVLIITCIAEMIGIIKFNAGIGVIILLPLLYAFILAFIFNPNISRAGAWVAGHDNQSASQWVLIFLMPFIAKFAVGIGPKIYDIIAAGPSLILQEIGNVATVIFALPIAVLLFGMGRESIGATHSIAREPNIALIADKFGLKSPEGVGVMGVYVTGTLFGAVYFSIMPTIIASWGVFDVRALAMACGVGSCSMMGACSAALAELLPEYKDDIIAFAASSNLLTYATGLFVSAFIALPVAKWLYKILAKFRRNRATLTLDVDKLGSSVDCTNDGQIKLSFAQTALALLFACFIMLVVNQVSTGTPVLSALFGMLILWGFCILGLMIKKLIPVGVPAVAWICIIAIIFSLPDIPTQKTIIAATDQLGLLPLITPALAYAGIAISKAEIELFKHSGVKITIIALLTFTGTYLGSAIIAQAFL